MKLLFGEAINGRVRCRFRETGERWEYPIFRRGIEIEGREGGGKFGIREIWGRKRLVADGIDI